MTLSRWKEFEIESHWQIMNSLIFRRRANEKHGARIIATQVQSAESKSMDGDQTLGRT